MNNFKNTNSNKRYYTLDYFYKTKFKSKVFKVSLNAGFSCPNIDGTVGFGGCIYCSAKGSGDYAGNVNDDLVKQFNDIKDKLDKKWPNSKYIGYFQAHTNTYAPLDILKEKYETILKLNNVVGLTVATRPDAISDECLDYLEKLSKRTFLTIELGLQTIHEKTTKLINRCHTLECFDEMVKKLKNRNINVVVHIINGLPYETKDMMLETIKHLNTLNIDGIKIHMLHIIKNTKLAKIYEDSPFHVLTKDEYVDIVCDQIELLNPNIVVNRITGDAKLDDLIEPFWTIKKVSVINDIDKELEKRDTYQGFMLDINNKIKQIIDKRIRNNDIIINDKFDNINGYFNVDVNILNNTFDINKYQGKISLILINHDIDDDLLSIYLKLLNKKGTILILSNNLNKYLKYNINYYNINKQILIEFNNKT